MFGGISPEHEVSVITGLQVVENLDYRQYDPHVVYFTKDGQTKYLAGLKNRAGLLKAPQKQVSFGRDSGGGYINLGSIIQKKIYPYAAYLSFHGGLGEGGGIQGLLETLGIPHTSTTQESSVLVMNKQLTKESVSRVGVNTVSGLSSLTNEIKNVSLIAKKIKKDLGLPVIIKPAHLGSSIGIKIAKTIVELELGLMETSKMDSEIVIEKYLTDFTEYNCAVRKVDNKLEVSEIEKPLAKDEILSFADKYERGGKKTSAAGMASLQRELPAKIDTALKKEIKSLAKLAFLACRCKGMVRIDFMVTKNQQIFLTEINPIPGSMAFYLWEATGIPFKQQITDLIEQSVADSKLSRSLNLGYSSEIVEKFVSSSQ